MGVTDKVNIQLEVTGGSTSAQEVERVNQALQKMGVDATTASEVGKKLSQNNKDVKEGLQALAIAASQVSPAAAEAVRGFSALKLAQEGLAGVSKNLGAAWSAVMGLLVSIPGGALAGLLAGLGVVTAISSKVKEWEENQKRAGEAARAAADALSQTREGRAAAAQSEARSIGRLAGSLGANVSPADITTIQSRARLLQEAVPTATADEALNAATVSITQHLDFNTAARSLAAKSFGQDVALTYQSMTPAERAKYGMMQSADSLTDAQRATIRAVKEAAPVVPSSDAVGAFIELNPEEQTRRRQEAMRRFREVQATEGLDQRGILDRLIGITTPLDTIRAERTARSQGPYTQAVLNNCIINNRSGEPTGVLGPPSESLTRVP